MILSFSALNRIVEKEAARNPSYRQGLEKAGKSLLSDARPMPDDALLDKLGSLGLEADPARLKDIFPRYISSQAIAIAMVDGAERKVPESQVDWVWFALTCLWERWRPDLANTEMVDDKMQAGYAALKAEQTQRACEHWLETWRDILAIMERFGIQSFDEFDRLFGGTNSVFNWVQDFETALHNAGNVEPRFHGERIAVCETFLKRSSGGCLTRDNFRRALAEAHFELGERERGDELFRGWLDESPTWGWGWIGWSDCYWLFAKDADKDAVRAERILKEGLGVKGVAGRAEILERLEILYDETGRKEQCDEVRKEIAAARRPKVSQSAPSAPPIEGSINLGEAGLPLAQSPDFASAADFGRQTSAEQAVRSGHVGRNEPCPCGSGKKYKKCCGRNA